MKDPNEIKSILARPFPAEALRERKGGGGRTFTYIGHDTATRRLIEATDNAYDWHLTNTIFREDGGRTTMIVSGMLCIEGLGCREGTGVQAIQPNGGEDQYKGAESDAIKRAAMRFGMAIDLYGEDIEGQIAEEQEQRVGVAAATQKQMPKGRTQLLAAIAFERDRLGSRMIDHMKVNKIKIADLKEDSQLEEFLAWCYAQS